MIDYKGCQDFIQRWVDARILTMPTGDSRNQMCDANIHLVCAFKCMQQANEFFPYETLLKFMVKQTIMMKANEDHWEDSHLVELFASELLSMAHDHFFDESTGDSEHYDVFRVALSEAMSEAEADLQAIAEDVAERDEK